jgi:hypothetical protein
VAGTLPMLRLLPPVWIGYGLPVGDEEEDLLSFDGLILFDLHACVNISLATAAPSSLHSGNQ